MNAFELQSRVPVIGRNDPSDFFEHVGHVGITGNVPVLGSILPSLPSLCARYCDNQTSSRVSRELKDILGNRLLQDFREDFKSRKARDNINSEWWEKVKDNINSKWREKARNNIYSEWRKKVRDNIW